MEQLSAVEGEIYQVKNQSGQDPLNYPIKLNNQIAALMGVVASTEAKPTAQSYEVFKVLSAQLDTQLGQAQGPARHQPGGREHRARPPEPSGRDPERGRHRARRGLVSRRATVLALAGLAVGLSAGCGGESRSRRAESVPEEALPIAADTILVPYAGSPVAAWLDGRRWLVVAAENDAAVIADFETKSVRPVGGPKNDRIAKPFAGFAVADTAYVADWAKRRLTAWGADGKLVDTIPAPAGTRGNLPEARDAAGQLYYEVPPVAGPSGAGNRDSIPIVRSDRAETRFDTLARLAPVQLSEVQRNTGKRYERLVFSGNDWWGVRPDGRLWIARVNQNQVNTVANGKEIKGEDLPDPVYGVQQMDRQAFINSFPEEMRANVSDLPFALVKPPFERAFADPAGNVWLEKSRVYGDSLRRYQVVDTSGMLARVFTAVGNGVIIAAGRGALLMVEQYHDGIRLMEIRVPARQ